MFLKTSRRNDYEETIQKYPNHTKIFTDGSKNDTSTACAFICQNISYKFKLDPITSNFSSEATAICKALEHIEIVTNNNKFVFITDSLSILKALQNTYISSASYKKSISVPTNS